MLTFKMQNKPKGDEYFLKALQISLLERILYFILSTPNQATCSSGYQMGDRQVNYEGQQLSQTSYVQCSLGLTTESFKSLCNGLQNICFFIISPGNPSLFQSILIQNQLHITVSASPGAGSKLIFYHWLPQLKKWPEALPYSRNKHSTPLTSNY